ncbi:AlbA family DNA-binding domain-containing protein [Facilibium subflavum]|uniref:AlbA family DNA-binding domain-containing protein n=1 Tax=Facilibium subflavum TaxID=2219058 RepID=UPI0013C33A39|nr:ATP-binding protein [Facilibium subflavum]
MDSFILVVNDEFDSDIEASFIELKYMENRIQNDTALNNSKICLCVPELQLDTNLKGYIGIVQSHYSDRKGDIVVKISIFHKIDNLLEDNFSKAGESNILNNLRFEFSKDKKYCLSLNTHRILEIKGADLLNVLIKHSKLELKPEDADKIELQATPKYIEVRKDILPLIESKRESERHDFKREWYSKDSKKQGDLLKDIISLANTLNKNKCRYIIIGIDDNGRFCKSEYVKLNRMDTANLTSTLSNAQVKFAFNHTPETEVITDVFIDGYFLDVIVIKNTPNKKPFFLTEDKGGVKRHCIYSRINDSNVIADPSSISKMWEERFKASNMDISYKPVPLALQSKEGREMQNRIKRIMKM